VRQSPQPPAPTEQQTTAPAVLLPARPGPRVVGMAAQERNRRVVERAGARPIDREELNDLPPRHPVLVVPEGAVLPLPLFGRLPEPDRPRRLVAPSGRLALLWGRPPMWPAA